MKKLGSIIAKQPHLVAIIIFMLFIQSIGFATTLKQVVQHTLMTNPTVLAASQNSAAEYYQIAAAKGQYYPQVNLFASGGREWSKNPLLQLDKGIYLTRTESGVNVEQLLFDGQKTQFNVAQRTHSYLAAEALSGATENQVALEVAEAYFNVLRNRQLVILNKQNVTVHRQNLAYVQRLFQRKIGTQVDLNLANSRLSAAESQLVEAQNNLQLAKVQYEQVTGIEVVSHMTMPILPLKVLPNNLRDIVYRAENKNPNVIAAEQVFNATYDGMRVTHAEFIPRLSFDASASYNANLDGIPGKNNDARFAFVFSYPLFRGGTDLANYNASGAEHVESLDQLREVKRSIKQNAANSWVELTYSKQRQRKLISYVNYANAVVKGYKKQFTFGKRPLFNVLDAERELFIAKTTYVNEKYDGLISVYRILASMGELIPALFAHI